MSKNQNKPKNERTFSSRFLIRLSFFRKLTKRVILAIVALAVILSFSTVGLLTVTQTISSNGTVTVTAVNIGVYSDSQCTQTLSSISWGSILAGHSASQTIYIKNTGNTPVTLSLTTNNWSPTGANGPITISWTKEGNSLGSGQILSADLTLAVSSTISGISNFSVNIVITGSG
jgi:hypothetical protein